MPLDLGGLSDAYVAIRTGIIARLFSSKDTTTLHTLPDPDAETNDFLNKPIRARDRVRIISFESDKGLQVEEPTTKFGQQGFHLAMKVKIPGIWPADIDPDRGINVRMFLRFDYSYSEATSPFFSPTSSGSQEISFTDAGATFVASPPSIGDPFGFGSTGIGTANIAISVVKDLVHPKTAPKLKLELDLVSMGTSYDTIFNPVHREFLSFSVPDFFLTPYFVSWVTNKTVGPTTLISSLNVTIHPRFVLV